MIRPIRRFFVFGAAQRNSLNTALMNFTSTPQVFCSSHRHCHSLTGAACHLISAIDSF
jgi:hypothetical protein